MRCDKFFKESEYKSNLAYGPRFKKGWKGIRINRHQLSGWDYKQLLFYFLHSLIFPSVYAMSMCYFNEN